MSSSDSATDLTPNFITEEAKAVVESLLPSKSKQRYLKSYNDLMKWRATKKKDIQFIGREALLRQREEGIRRQYVQLLLTDHDHETDLWSWGGEPIYRDGNYCGQTTTTSYGYTFKKQVCLGFVQNLDKAGVPQPVTHDYVLSGHYEIDIAGIRYAAKCNLHSPNLPTKYPDKERDVYQATRKLHEPKPLGRHYQP